MKLPIVHSGVVDTILAALQAGGYIPNAADIDSIRNVSANLTEANRDYMAAHLAYGGAGSVMKSLADIYCLLNTDNLPSSSHYDFFKVIRGQVNPPITDWKNQLFQVYFNSANDGSNSRRASAILGSDTNLLRTAPDGSYSTGELYLGSYRTNSTDISAYGKIECGSASVHSGSILYYSGMSCRSSKYMEFSFGESNCDIAFWCNTDKIVNANDPNTPASGTQTKVAGACLDLNTSTLPVFYVGPYARSTASEALTIGRFIDSGFTGNDFSGYEIKLNRADPKRWLNFTTGDAYFDSYFTINGTVSTKSQNRHPGYSSPGIIEMARSPVFAVYGVGSEAAYAHRDVVLIKALKDAADEYHGHVLRLRALDGYSSTQRYHYIKAERWDEAGSVWRSMFRVTNEGNVYAQGTFTPNTPDVSESILTNNAFEVGDVLVILPDGSYAKSTEVACTNVMGVIAEKPGVLLGGGGEDPEHRQPLAVCGFVNAKCTTTGGEIIPGDRLVSAPDGCAQKAAEPVQPGTLIGKAMEPLAKENDQDVTKKIKVFVNLQ